MVTINSVLGSPTQDTLGTLAQAEAYFARRAYEVTPWTGATDDQKKAALTTATEVIFSTSLLSGQNLLWKQSYEDRIAQRTLAERTPPFVVDWDQGLQAPKDVYGNGEPHEFLLCSVDSATSTTVFTDDSITSHFEVNELVYGSALFMSGDLRGEIQTITANNASGQVTVDSAFSAQPDTGDQFLVIKRCPDGLHKAVFEEALYILGGNFDYRANLARQGVQDLEFQRGQRERLRLGTQGSLMSEMAFQFLKPFLARKVILQ